VLPFGTVGWETEIIRRNALDVANGFRLEEVKLASSDAARIAFSSGAVDMIVTDLLWAARLKAEGRSGQVPSVVTAEAWWRQPHPSRKSGIWLSEVSGSPADRWTRLGCCFELSHREGRFRSISEELAGL